MAVLTLRQVAHFWVLILWCIVFVISALDKWPRTEYIEVYTLHVSLAQCLTK